LELECRLSDDLPTKLKHDAIVEAAFEARIDADPASVPEILFGRLADTAEWRGFTQRRLPTADIPAALRRADPNLRYQPAIDLIHPEGSVTGESASRDKVRSALDSGHKAKQKRPLLRYPTSGTTAIAYAPLRVDVKSRRHYWWLLA
jgi:hypothetical protein